MLSPNFWIIITLVTGMGIADYAVSKFFGILPINNKKIRRDVLQEIIQ